MWFPFIFSVPPFPGPELETVRSRHVIASCSHSAQLLLPIRNKEDRFQLSWATDPQSHMTKMKAVTGWMATASQGLLKSEFSSKYIKRSIKNQIQSVPLSSTVKHILSSRKLNNFRKAFAGWEWKWYRLPQNPSHPKRQTCTLTGRQAACHSWPLLLPAPVLSCWKALMLIYKLLSERLQQLCPGAFPWLRISQATASTTSPFPMSRK